MSFVNKFEKTNFTYDYRSDQQSPIIPQHFHNYYELFYFQEGDANYMVEGNIYNLHKGDILFTNPRELHCPVFKSDKPYMRSIIQLKPSFLSEFISEKYSPFTALEKRKIGTENKIDAIIAEKYDLNKKFDIIGSYAQSDLLEREIMIKSHLIQILVVINTIVTTNESPQKYSKIDNIIQYINNNITKRITLDDMEKEFYLSKFHISHSFKEKTGFSITEYINHKKIAMSKELILDKVPLTEVADMVGFCDYSSFYRAFVKIVGVPPSHIKK